MTGEHHVSAPAIGYRCPRMPWLFWLGFGVALAIYVLGITLAVLNSVVPVPFGLVWGAIVLGIGYLEGWKQGYAFQVVDDTLVWRAAFRRRTVEVGSLTRVIVRRHGRGSAIEMGPGNLLFLTTPDREARALFEESASRLTSRGVSLVRL
jgi:hypothetical protein